MSRASSGIKKYSNGNEQKSQNNLIIIQKDRKGNENLQKNLIIIENQHFKAQSNIEHEINKEKINKRVKEIEKNVLNLNTNTSTKNNLIKIENNENIKSYPFFKKYHSMIYIPDNFIFITGGDSLSTIIYEIEIRNL